MTHERVPACGVAGPPPPICRPPPPNTHTHTAYTDTRFMYLCTVAAQLKGIWLEGVGGEEKGKEAVWSADRDGWGDGGWKGGI